MITVNFGGMANIRKISVLTKQTTSSLTIRSRSSRTAAGGEKLQDWVNSPFLVATFGPRVTLGALLTAPERLPQLPDDLNKVRELLTGSQPANEKANILLEEIEIRLTECLERGASVEADIYQNLRSLLPENIQDNIPEELPLVPSKKTSDRTSSVTSQEDNGVGVTYTSESISEERAASERTGLTDAIIALKTARSALKTNESQAREKMLKMNLKEERDILRTLLVEITTNGTEISQLIDEAKELLNETEDLI